MGQNFSTVGAGEGNRTLVVSLEGFCSTIELHPHAAINIPQTRFFESVAFLNLWWRGKDSNLRRQSRQIYSLIPLTAREPLLNENVIMDKEVQCCQCFFVV